MLPLSRALRAAVPRASIPSASRCCLAAAARLQLPVAVAVGRPLADVSPRLLSTSATGWDVEEPAEDDRQPQTGLGIKTERLRFEYLPKKMNDKDIRELCIAHGVDPVRIGSINEKRGAARLRNRRVYVECASLDDADRLRESLTKARLAQPEPAVVRFKRVKEAEPSYELFLTGIPPDSTKQSLLAAFKSVPRVNYLFSTIFPADSPRRSYAIMHFDTVEQATEVLETVQRDGGQTYGFEGLEARYGEPKIMQSLPVEPTTELVIQRLPLSSEGDVVTATLIDLGATAVTFKRNKTGDQATATASFPDVAAALQARSALNEIQDATRLPIVNEVWRTPNDMLPPDLDAEKPDNRKNRRRFDPIEESAREPSSSSWARPPSARWLSSSYLGDRADRQYDRPDDRRSADGYADRPVRQWTDRLTDRDFDRPERPAGSLYGLRPANSGHSGRFAGGERSTGDGYRSQRRPDASLYNREDGYQRRDRLRAPSSHGPGGRQPLSAPREGGERRPRFPRD